MEYRHLGKSGVMVSPLCLGTMNFGPQTSEHESFSIMDMALDEGLNFFDTANVYGRKLGEGITEQIIGRWLSQGGGRREKIVLATKVYGRMGESPNERRLSAFHIRRACEESLRRLHTDHIDLYQMHHIDLGTPWDEIWQAMETLVTQGKIVYCGSSNFSGWNLAAAQYEAKARHFLGLVSEQSLYNLTARTIELEVIPACRNLGLGLIPWSPLAGGLLGGMSQAVKDGRRNSDEIQQRWQKLKIKIDEYEALCQNLGESPANVALAWLLHNPTVTSPIIGPRSTSQLRDALRSIEIKLTEDTLTELNTIFPGPGGEAPEAYAW